MRWPGSISLRITVLYLLHFHIANGAFVEEIIQQARSTTSNTDSSIFKDLADLPHDILRPCKRPKTHYLIEDSTKDDFCSNGTDESLWGNGEELHHQFEVDPQTQPSIFPCINSGFKEKESHLVPEKVDSLWGEGHKLHCPEAELSTSISSVDHVIALWQKDTHQSNKEFNYPHEEGPELGAYDQQGNPLGLLPMKKRVFSQENISEDEKMEMEEQIYRYDVVGACLKGAKEEYFNGYSMVDLIQKAKNSLRDQSIEEFRKWKQFDDRIKEKITEILQLYMLSYKTKGLIIMGGSSKNQFEAFASCNKIQTRIFTNSNKDPSQVSQFVMNKIRDVGESLHICHYWFKSNGLEEMLVGKTTMNDQDLLGWFYNLVFMETVCLLNHLIVKGKFGRIRAFKVALDLMPFWFQTQDLSITTEKYKKLAALVIQQAT
ncbi:hypothetical protein PGT21_014225 [Puccinia graminis f. sp. tritici]|uniref:Uncharacterized protein n=1 Tax=Puccinia graminis f. sp. tritici TaxID=56615 RepID=A0A5B0QAK3_PUCGR|nr:hypothetical protein PGT21_014225 [Puccinia graminis f. sp. tritici]